MSELNDKKEVKDDEKKEPEVDFTIARLAGLLVFGVEYMDSSGNTFWISWLKSRQLTTAQAGMAVSLLGFGFVCITPLAPHVIRKYGANKTQYYAAWVYLCGRLGFWVAYYLYGTQLFVCCCFNFLSMGITACFQESAAQAWALASVPKERRTEATAMMFGVRLMGGLFGPLIGGMLFVIGGYMLPTMSAWFVYAVILLCCRKKVFDNPVPPDPIQSTASGSILQCTQVKICFAMNTILGALMFFNYVWLQPFMINDYGLNSFQYGLMICGQSVNMGIFAQVGAKVVAAVGPMWSYIVGVTLWAMFGVFMGPSPFAPFLPSPSPDSLWVPLLGIFFSTAGLGIIFPTCMPLPMNYAIEAGWGRDDAAAQNSMLLLIGGGLSQMMGPSAGGLMVDTFGIPWTATSAAAFGWVTFSGLTGLLVMVDRAQSKDPKSQKLLGI